ncbi:tandem-95 repeat protein [Pseudoalteromonas sp. T1lg65]|uniref:tandem-95 repeat protein n=1 Tax=Pseudoalteromonas sp. T1lg65 TaxID=2077101 RepID=UPI003F7B3113
MNKFNCGVLFTLFSLIFSNVVNASANQQVYLKVIFDYLLDDSFNNSPYINIHNEAYTVIEDTPIRLDLLGNASSTIGATLSLSSAYSSFGVVRMIGDGAVSYLPKQDYAGIDTITYTVKDSEGGQARGRATIRITGVNDAPTLISDSFTLESNTPTMLNVLDNDTDVDGDTLTIVRASAAFGHAEVINGTQIKYTSNESYVGEDSVIYEVSDSQGESAAGKATVTVIPQNKYPPVINSQRVLSVNEDTTFTFLLEHFSVSDVDSPHNNLTLIVEQGRNYSLKNDNTVLPSQDFYGTLNVPVRVTDGKNTSEAFIAKLTVNNVNDAPETANLLRLEAKENTQYGPISFRMGLAYDPDIKDREKDPRMDKFRYVFTLTTLPEDDSKGRTRHGRFTQVAGEPWGTFVYTPDPNFTGRDQIFFWVFDDLGYMSNRGNINIDVTANTPPKIISQNIGAVKEHQPFRLSLGNFTVSNPDNLNFTFNVKSESFYGYDYDVNTGLISVKDDFEQSSLNVYIYLQDSKGNVENYTAVVTIIAENDAPIVTDFVHTLKSNEQSSIFKLRDNIISDAEAFKKPELFDRFTYQFVDQQNSTSGRTENGRIIEVSEQGVGSFIFIPEDNFYGEEVVNYWVKDDQGLQSKSGTITFQVSPQPIESGASLNFRLLNGNLVWSEVDNAVRYELQSAECQSAQECSENHSFTWFTVSSVAQSTSYQIDKSTQTNRIFRLRACNVADICTQWSYAIALKEKQVIFIHTDLLGSPVAESIKDK